MPRFRQAGDRLPTGQRFGGLLCVGLPGHRPAARKGSDDRHRRDACLGLGVDSAAARAVQWLGLDPTNDQLVDQRYIVVGRGRDYADVPPLRGIIYTNSENSVIDVSVDVVPFEGDALHA